MSERSRVPRSWPTLDDFRRTIERMSASPQESERVNRQMLSYHEAGHVIFTHLTRAIQIERVFWMEVDGRVACATQPGGSSSELKALLSLLAGHSAEALMLGAPFEAMATRLSWYEKSDWRRALELAEHVLPEQERADIPETLRTLGEAMKELFRHERISPVLVDLAQAIAGEPVSLAWERISAIIEARLSFYTPPALPESQTGAADYLAALLAPLEAWSRIRCASR